MSRRSVSAPLPLALLSHVVYCLVNPRSGGYKGDKAAVRLSALGIRCFSLPELSKDPKKCAELAQELHRCHAERGPPYVVCCGGDGTGTWALTVLSKAQEHCSFEFIFATVPMGSGNDLSRCLGWGNMYPGSRNLYKHLECITSTTEFTQMDRWRIDFKAASGEKKEWLTNEMLLYFSFGYTAQIALNFHKAREDNGVMVGSPTRNKFRYAFEGAKHMFTRFTEPFNDRVKITANGQNVVLPSHTKSVIINNTLSMSDGIFFWGNQKSSANEVQDWSPPSLGDGKLELMCSKGMSKFLRLRFNIGHYHRLAQCSTIEIEFKEPMALQLDGEAWMEEPGKITITHIGQVTCAVGHKGARGVTEQCRYDSSENSYVLPSEYSPSATPDGMLPYQKPDRPRSCPPEVLGKEFERIELHDTTEVNNRRKSVPGAGVAKCKDALSISIPDGSQSDGEGSQQRLLEARRPNQVMVSPIAEGDEIATLGPSVEIPVVCPEEI